MFLFCIFYTYVCVCVRAVFADIHAQQDTGYTVVKTLAFDFIVSVF